MYRLALRILQGAVVSSTLILCLKKIGHRGLILAYSSILVFGLSSSILPQSDVGQERDVPQSGPDLRAVSPEAREMIANACNGDRLLHGPAAYYNCVRRQLDALQHSPGKPDLSGLSSDERAMIANACNGDRLLHGPAAYYNCVRWQLDTLQGLSGRPDLSSASKDERIMIANACNGNRLLHGPAAYYNCVSRQLDALQHSSGKPDLSGLSREEKRMIASACNGDRLLHGPAAYYNCVRQQITELEHLAIPQENNEERATSGTFGEASNQNPNISEPTPATSSSGVVVPTPLPVTEAPPSQGKRSDFNGWIRIGLLAAVASLIRALKARRVTQHCSSCGIDTKNVNGLCTNCQTQANANRMRQQEEERREAQQRAEEARRQEAEARAEEQRRRAEEQRRKIHTLAELQKLSGQEFEDLVASLFLKDGYKTVKRGGSGDEGIDLVLEAAGKKDVVQCKRWKADVGSPVIREFYGSMMHAGARHGYVITTASFSKSARDFTVGKPITLIGSQDLLAWLFGVSSRKSSVNASQGANNGFDPCQILGVSRSASKAEIRAAYLQLLAKYHPDKVTHLGQEFQDMAKEKTEAIIRAYQILSNPDRRGENGG